MQLIDNVWMNLRRGKSLPRAFMNAFLEVEKDWHGAMIDIGGAKSSSYQGIIPLDRFDRVDTVNVVAESGANIISDAASISVADNSYDCALCLNLLEHVEDPRSVLREMKRVLKNGGVGYIYIPFFVRVHPDPTDYQRLTPQGLERDIHAAGLRIVEMRPAAGGPFTAAVSQIHFLLPKWFALPLIRLAFALDGIIARKKPELAHAWPLAFYIKVRKESL